MKLAVLADIHANFVALQTVAAHVKAWQPDAVVVAGDIVNRGPRSLECLQFVQTMQRTEGWRVVGGNHEDYVLTQDRPDAPRSGPRFEIDRHSFWTYQQLDGHVAALAALPFQQSLSAPDGSEVRVTHASMRSKRDGIYSFTPDHELRQKIRPYTPVLCVGHTHRPLVRQVDGTLVVNAGSVGLPFDGDRRAAYARLTWHNRAWQAQIIRVDYDIRAAERDFFETDFFEGSGPLGRVILNELRTSESRLFYWTVEHQDRVLAGDQTMTEAVDDFLANL